jgi:hypothetical protein
MGAGPLPGAVAADDGSSPQRPASSGGQPSPEAYCPGGGGIPGASPAREGFRRQSLPGQGQQQAGHRWVSVSTRAGGPSGSSSLQRRCGVKIVDTQGLAESRSRVVHGLMRVEALTPSQRSVTIVGQHPHVVYYPFH